MLCSRVLSFSGDPVYGGSLPAVYLPFPPKNSRFYTSYHAKSGFSACTDSDKYISQVEFICVQNGLIDTQLNLRD